MVVAMTLSFRCDKDYADALMDAGRGADGCREGDDHGAFLLANGRWMQELVGFRSPLVARATADGGVRDARRPSGGRRNGLPWGQWCNKFRSEKYSPAAIRPTR